MEPGPLAGAFIRKRSFFFPLALGACLGLSGPSLPALENGDFDESGTLNVSDAVYLIEYLFFDGSPPVPVIVKHGVPSSGETNCYGNEGVIPCPAPGEPFYGQDGNQLVIPNQFEVFKPDPSDTTTWYTVDYTTGLMWQYEPPHERMTWFEGKEYVKTLRIAGYSDWRLPNVIELVSILKYGSEPRIDTTAFILILNEPWYHTYMTSTSVAYPGNSEELVVSFKYGLIHYSPKDPGGYKPDFVRAVRTIQRTRQNGDTNGDGEVDLSDTIRLLFHIFGHGEEPVLLREFTGLPASFHCEAGESPDQCYPQDESDSAGNPRSYEVVKPDPEDSGTWYTIDGATGLVWQYDEELSMMTWEEALAHCEALELGGFTDWRLPSVKELQSIINYGKTYLAIDEDAFGTKSYPLEWRDNWVFWSSTPFYTMFMDVGLIGNDYSTSRCWVRAVRTLPPSEE